MSMNLTGGRRVAVCALLLCALALCAGCDYYAVGVGVGIGGGYVGGYGGGGGYGYDEYYYAPDYGNAGEVDDAW